MRWPWAKAETRTVTREDFFGRPLPGVGRITPEQAASLAPVFSAVRLISETISSLPIHVVERRPDGTRARVEHPALRALGNPCMSRQTLFESLLARLELSGNSYAEILCDGSGRAVELWPLAHNVVRVERQGRALLYHVSTANGVVTVGPEKILHLRFGVLSKDGITGCDPCQMLAADLTAAQGARDAAANYLANGLLSSGTLEHPASLKEDMIERLRAQFAEHYGGSKNAGRPLLLEEGVRWNAIGGDPEKSQLLQSREFSVRDVARIWNIPASKLGDDKKTSYSSLEQDSIAFLQTSILPRVRRIEAELNRALLQDDRYGFAFELDGLLRATTADRYAALQKATGGAWLTANEARKLEDLPPIDGGDELVRTPGAVTATDNGDGSPVTEIEE